MSKVQNFVSDLKDLFDKHYKPGQDISNLFEDKRFVSKIEDMVQDLVSINTVFKKPVKKSVKKPPTKDEVIEKLKNFIKSYMQDGDYIEIDGKYIEIYGTRIMREANGEQVEDFIIKNRNQIKDIAQDILDDYGPLFSDEWIYESLIYGNIFEAADKFIIDGYSPNNN